MANDSFEFDTPPGFVKPTHEYGQDLGSAAYKDQFLAPVVAELLKSTAAFTQRGVTLEGGQGILPTGCVLAQKTSSQKYHAYAATASDGTQTPLGILRDARDTGPSASPKDALANLVIRGILDLTLVSGTDTTSLITGGTGTGGGIGSGATGVATTLKARVDLVNGLFIF